ncbi:MAG: cell envelope integrity protein TolA [Gammaproteobacteria bacterium]|jgi:colicin import membrane protein|nr:cell envelope integrity protein TolA [Gammaproteobacteria bacterium]
MRSLREQLGFGEGELTPKLVILNGYPIAVVTAVTLHIVLLAGLLYLQTSSQSQALELVQPTVIKALLIDENPQVTNQRNQERRRVEDQRRKNEQAAAAQKRREDAAAQKRRDEAAAQKKAAEERQRVADAKARTERETREREDAARAEALRQEQLAEEARERREEQARREREATADAAAAEAASSEFELIQSATGLIQQLVTENWSRPPSARNGMRAVIQIRMLPTGELIDATITQSSGDPAFDRSAENAVYRAAPFSELTALPIRVFNQNFRTLSLIFQPEDLLN